MLRPAASAPRSPAWYVGARAGSNASRGGVPGAAVDREGKVFCHVAISLLRCRLARYCGEMASEAAIVSTTRVGHLLRLALIGFGVSVVPLDSAVNIAFPDITGSFGLPIAMIQCGYPYAYVITHTGLMLALCRVGDIWSHSGIAVPPFRLAW